MTPIPQLQKLGISPTENEGGHRVVEIELSSTVIVFLGRHAYFLITLLPPSTLASVVYQTLCGRRCLRRGRQWDSHTLKIFAMFLILQQFPD